jgi:glycosyltransferase involved in cell wall biosynthesis
MAAGLPVIASPVGANAQIVQQDETGRLADTPAKWMTAIFNLSDDAELRRRMGTAGRERVEREYSLDRAVQVWANLLAR